MVAGLTPSKFIFLFLSVFLKTLKFSIVFPCDSNFKPLITYVTLEPLGLVNNQAQIGISNLFVLR
jgi:hypothetical protein